MVSGLNRLCVRRHKKTPYESCPPNPINYYGYSKLMGEAGIQYSGCDYLIFRTSWIYHPDYGTNFYSVMQICFPK